MAALPVEPDTAPMTPSIQIRRADLNDRNDGLALLALLDAYCADPMGAGQGLSHEARACVIPALRAMPGALVLLAFADSSPVGTAVCFVGFSTFRARGLLNIHDLTVREPWRGRGIARRLVLAVEAIARARGYCKVTLEVREDNARARRLYAGLGYGAGAAGGQEAPHLFLEKRLSD